VTRTSSYASSPADCAPPRFEVRRSRGFLSHWRKANIGTINLAYSRFPSDYAKVQNIDKEDEYVHHQYAHRSLHPTQSYVNPKFTVGYAPVVGRLSFLPFIGDFKPELIQGVKLDKRLPNHRWMLGRKLAKTLTIVSHPRPSSSCRSIGA
jgi:hypothetical protein